MESVQEIKGYRDKEEEQLMEETGYKKLPFLSSSSSYSSSKYIGPRGYEKQQRLWLETFESEEEAARSYDRTAALEFQGQEAVANFNKNIHLTGLSLRNNDEVEADGGGSIEREHMFDKVVTPSDVGKLNRLVIPKQHAEKYFPLDSSANEKGLLLNFEDRNGKAWRFRYSYWNSSQSYVMTKGWSRFVKEKKLDAGDIVSFERGVGESGKDCWYIDWRRRPDAPDPTSNISSLHLPNHLLPFPHSSVEWGRLYSLPQIQSMSMSMPMPMPMPIPIPREDHEHLQQQQLNYNNIDQYPYNYHHHDHYQRRISTTHDCSRVNSSGFRSQYYLRPSSSLAHQIGTVQHGGEFPMVINSVPVVHGKTAAKRLRLFGVNMECASDATQDDPQCDIPHATIPSLSRHIPSASHSTIVQLNLDNGAPLPPTAPDQFTKKGKASLSFDLDL